MGFSPSLPGQPFLLPPHHRPAFLNQPPPSLSQSPKLLPQSTPFIPPAILPPPLIPPAILPAPPNSALPVGPQEGPFCALRPPPSAPNPSWHFPPLPSQPAGLLATGQSSGQLPVGQLHEPSAFPPLSSLAPSAGIQQQSLFQLPTSFANLFTAPIPSFHIPNYPPTIWKNGKLALTIPQSMLSSSKESFSFAFIGKFAGKRPSLEWVEEKAKFWALSRPCLVSLTIKGYSIFYFNSSEDKAHILGLSPLSMERKKLFFLPWSPWEDESDWPSIASVWVRFSGLPYHCWSQHIIFSLANSIGQPIKLDDITSSQRILTFARVLVNVDLSKRKPQSILVDLQGETELEIVVSFENYPCSVYYQTGHYHQSCPSATQPGKPASPNPEPVPITKATQPPPSLSPTLETSVISLDVLPPPPNPKKNQPGNVALAPPLTTATTQNIFSPPQNHLSFNPSSSTPPVYPANLSTLVSPTLSSIQPTSTQPHSLHNTIIPPTNTSSPGQAKAKTIPPPSSKLPVYSPSINDLPYDVTSLILEKTSTPTIDTSNPFSIVENCSFVDQTINPNLYGRNLQAFFEGNSSIGPPPGFEQPLDISDSLATPALGHPAELPQGKIQASPLVGPLRNHPRGKGKIRCNTSGTGPINRRSRSKWTSPPVSPC
ncbi:hypothetical protein AAC387_Pa12g0372 [Persea americana]